MAERESIPAPMPANWRRKRPSQNCTHSIIALLNDVATPVGTVHFGVVHVLITPSEAVQPNELAIAEASFKTIEEFRPLRDRMENLVPNYF